MHICEGHFPLTYETADGSVLLLDEYSFEPIEIFLKNYPQKRPGI